MTAPAPLAVELDDLLDRFEAAWQAGGGPPSISAFLPLAGRPAALCTLIHIDIHYRWRRLGPDRWGLAEYAARFPELGPADRWPAELIAQEYNARRMAGDAPDSDDYLRRFPAQADALRAELAFIDAEHPADAGTADTVADNGPTLGESKPRPPREVSEFFDTVRGLGCAPSGALDGTPPGLATRAEAAEWLVARNALTPFQADEVLAGRSSGLVVGPYVLAEPLGSGGSGAVYRAVHQGLRRTVALKVVRTGLTGDLADRFRREAEALGRLSHPNVVQPYDTGAADGSLYLAMECLAGADLQRAVDRGGPLPVADAVEVARQVAAALQHLHENGLAHRDVKPANLFLVAGADRKPVVKLLDLGLAAFRAEANLRDGLTAHGAVVGTVDYMAPEQADDAHAADIRADLYSLGCTLFFLLTGRPPFPGGSLAQRLRRHAQDRPPDPRILRPDVPVGLARLTQKLMAKRPGDRFQTPAGLIAAFDAQVGSGTSRRRRGLAVAAGLVGIVAGGATVVFGLRPPSDVLPPLTSVAPVAVLTASSPGAAEPRLEMAPPPRLRKLPSRLRGAYREYWLSVPGSHFSAIPTTAPPDGAEIVDALEQKMDYTANCGQRLRAFLHPPAEGTYRFRVAGDNSVVLFLSKTGNPKHKQGVAWVTDFCKPGEWSKLPTQTSAPISLKPNGSYYLEVMHKQDFREQFFAVQWEGPGFGWKLLDGDYLSPWQSAKKP